MNVHFVAINAMAVIWGRWLLTDVAVRADYNQGVKNACENILEAMQEGTLTAINAARAGGTNEFYLEKNAQTRYGKPVADLTNDEALMITTDMVRSAGRAKGNVTALMGSVGVFARGMIVLSAALSVHPIVVSVDWKLEFGKQVACWTGTFAGGSLMVIIGKSISPFVAVFVGGAVGMVGNLVGAQLYTVVAGFLMRRIHGGSRDKNCGTKGNQWSEVGLRLIDKFIICRTI